MTGLHFRAKDLHARVGIVALPSTRRLAGDENLAGRAARLEQGRDTGRRPPFAAIRTCKRLLAAVQGLAAVIGISAAAAENASAPNVKQVLIAFHIPSQPLANALQIYGEKAGVQVLYESHSAVGRTSAAVEGNYTPTEALTMLLSGTDLKVQYARPNAITLASRNTPSDLGVMGTPAATELSLGTLRVRATDEAEDVGRLHDYSESLQADIQKVLHNNSGTRGGNYRATLDLWIDPLRIIQRVELVRSTGNQDRDAAVEAALRGFAVSRPTPARAPQPVRVVIVVRSMQ
ncbi:secretin and TonB N-terminal domain-containing protein [Bradyrhizobium sp. HKCCYLS1011]|uniref:secretin and TonB N-terminal domain-containing protein n=1 Tax=Bradyrhizobium sp. HKCCYLS1011 TaxID=3420733 RepID=UPI003EB6FCBF